MYVCKKPDLKLDKTDSKILKGARKLSTIFFASPIPSKKNSLNFNNTDLTGIIATADCISPISENRNDVNTNAHLAHHLINSDNDDTTLLLLNTRNKSNIVVNPSLDYEQSLLMNQNDEVNESSRKDSNNSNLIASEVKEETSNDDNDNNNTISTIQPSKFSPSLYHQLPILKGGSRSSSSSDSESSSESDRNNDNDSDNDSNAEKNKSDGGLLEEIQLLILDNQKHLDRLLTIEKRLLNRRK